MMYAADEVYDTAELEEPRAVHDPLEDDHPVMCHDCHREYGEPDPECEDCQEARGLMWQRMMEPY